MTSARCLRATPVLLLVGRAAQGQEALQMSQAGERAALIQKTTGSGDYYNLKAGPVYLRFQAQMSTEYNDNATYAEGQRSWDMIFRPTLNIRAWWPITQRNTLFLDTGVGYAMYLRNSRLSTVTLSPNTGLTYKIYAGDFTIDLHDRVTASDYVAQDPSVHGNFIRLENSSGIGMTWNLNKLILSATYDHIIDRSLTGTFTSSDNDADLFTFRAGLLVKPTSQVGIETGGGWTSYGQNVLQDNAHYSVGAFYQAKLTDYISIDSGAGFVSYLYSSTSTVASLNQADSFYLRLGITHRVNDWVSYTLSGGRQLENGITADLSTSYYVRATASWKVVRKLTTDTSLEWQHGSTSGGLTEKYNSYGGGIGLRYRITDKLGSGLRYDLLVKSSDLALSSYTQNRVTLDLTYDF